MKGLLRIAFLATAFLLCQGTWALAGTTGSLTGTVTLEGTTTPVANAKVTVSSPSQTSTTTTDSGGHFGFVSLAPDTYTVTVSEEGVIEPTKQAGVTVQADNQVNVAIATPRFIKTLTTITSRTSADLVKPGTTADVYSVNEKTQARTAVLGGGGGSDQGYSAIAALPGAFVPPGQSGWYQTVYIRGGDYDQVGYEFDGVPVNRSFDNYPTTNLSALGQQELQLYTGASPANSESQGLAGYINQVIKAGTYPGFGSVSLGIGGPGLYNKANIEFGGATPDRNFSYYVGIGLVDTAPRYYDSNNGASIAQTYGSPWDITNNGAVQNGFPNGNIPKAFHNADNDIFCSAIGHPDPGGFSGCYANTAYFGAFPAGAGGYIMGPLTITDTAKLTDRENVFNFHVGLPHKRDSGKDDIQLLYDVFQLYTYYNSSANDWGGPGYFAANCGANVPDGCPGFGPNGQAAFFSGYQLNNVAPGTVFLGADPSQAANVVPYAYPSEGTIGQFGNVATNKRDTADNGQGIYKLQYQRNINSNSYLRVYGYIFYSWWFLHGANTLNNDYVGCCPSDYELWTHTRGGSVSYVSQLSQKHLLNVDLAYSTASTVRDNNTQMLNGLSIPRGTALFKVAAASPTSGICYGNANGATYGPAAGPNPFGPQSCEPGLGADNVVFNAGFLCGGGSPACVDLSGGVPAPTGTCNGGACAWMTGEVGPYATFNTVTPRFYALSLQDTWKPTDRLTFNLGLRENIYRFEFTPTGGGARDFWLAAWNQSQCYSPTFQGGGPFDKTNPPVSSIAPILVTQPCSALTFNGAHPFIPATMVNATANGGAVNYPELEPRIGGTYTLNPDNVLRFSAGRYSQPANAAFQQYNALQQNLFNFIGPLFFKFGFNTPNHTIRPSISYNYDLSLEHHFANTQTSFKLTPFYRATSDQVQQLFIDPKTAFVSGLNAGKQTTSGVEFELNWGNFNANGWAGQFAYTYTHSLIKYSALPSGLTVLSSINSDIQHYNSFTSACVGAVSSTSPTSLCGVDGGSNANATDVNPCLPIGCVGTVPVANPYFNAPAQGLFDPNGSYTPYDIIPAGVQLSEESFITPHEATLVLQWKHDKWSFIPAFQFHAGTKYGAPEGTIGFDPSSCGGVVASPIAGDLRYPYGGTGSPADATHCTQTLVIPDTTTKVFDAPGAFTEPSQFSGHFAIGYDATSRVSYQLNVANIINTCFGGTREPWVSSDRRLCNYGVINGNVPSAGNLFNPGDTIQPFVKYPYFPSNTTGASAVVLPLQASFNVTFKL
jgi:TonB dependent receptor/Carboxypeptidase regulatory-like domain